MDCGGDGSEVSLARVLLWRLSSIGDLRFRGLHWPGYGLESGALFNDRWLASWPLNSLTCVLQIEKIVFRASGFLPHSQHIAVFWGQFEIFERQMRYFLSVSGSLSNKGQFSGIQFDGSTVWPRRFTERLLNDNHHQVLPITRVSNVT